MVEGERMCADALCAAKGGGRSPQQAEDSHRAAHEVNPLRDDVHPFIRRMAPLSSLHVPVYQGVTRAIDWMVAEDEM